MKYRIVKANEVHETRNIRRWAHNWAEEIVGIEANLRLRDELVGAPKFKNLLGPFWDGDAIRYEDRDTYDALSV